MTTLQQNNAATIIQHRNEKSAIQSLLAGLSIPRSAAPQTTARETPSLAQRIQLIRPPDDLPETAGQARRARARREQLDEQVKSAHRQSFLKQLYDVARKSDVSSTEFDAAINDVYRRVDTLLLAGEFEECDQILQNVDAGRLPTVLCLPFLTATKAAKDNLRSRRRFWLRAYEVAFERFGEAKANRLFDRVK